jgi:crossover junction endodeoxyribonuclease RuvC
MRGLSSRYPDGLLVLGLDPGLHRTGIAIVGGRAGALTLRHAECIEIPTGSPDADRLARLFGLLEAVLVTFSPDVASVEKLFFSTNRQSALRVSEARGVALCAIARAGVPVAEYTPMQVKESVAGFGGAAKDQLARMTVTLLDVERLDGPDDVTDACAIAVCHHHRAPLDAQGKRPAASRAGTTPALAAAERAARLRFEAGGAR